MIITMDTDDKYVEFLRKNPSLVVSFIEEQRNLFYAKLWVALENVGIDVTFEKCGERSKDFINSTFEEVNA